MFEVTLFITRSLWNYPAFDNIRKTKPGVVFNDELLERICATHKTLLPRFRFRGIIQILRNGFIVRSFIREHCTPELLHVNNAQLIEIIIGAKLAGINRIIGCFHLLPKGSYSEINKPYKHMLQRLSAGFLSKIIVPSAITAEKWCQALKIPKEKVIVIPNGVKTNENLSDQVEITQVRQSLGIDEHRILIVCVGTLAQHKGHETLLEALKLLKDRNPSKLPATLIVGDGPLYEQLREKTRNLELDAHVIFTGFQNDVRKILAAADFAVLPSLYESFGIVILEAMAEGKPVIASRTGGIPEIIIDGETGILFPPEDSNLLAEAIEELTMNDEKRAKMGIACQDRVNSLFTVGEMAKEYQSVYLDVLNDNKDMIR